MIESIVEKYVIKKKIVEVSSCFNDILANAKQDLIQANEFSEDVIEGLEILFDKVTFDVYDVDIIIISIKFDVFHKNTVVGKYFKSFSSDFKECVDSDIYACDPPLEEREMINKSSLLN